MEPAGSSTGRSVGTKGVAIVRGFTSNRFVNVPLTIMALAMLLFLPGKTIQALQVDSDSIKIGVLANRGAEICLEMWGPTADYLTEKIPGCSFTIVPLGFDEVNPAVERGDVDFILANSSFYVGLEYLYGASRIATLKNLLLGEPFTIFGGVIFCRADRKDIKHLTDLKGKTFMAVEEKSFGGWLVAWKELKEHGIDPYSDFADLSFGGTHDAVIHAVQEGRVDAGSVRADALERMTMEGVISIEDFFVFHEHNGDCTEMPFQHSTRSYPEWPFAEVRHTPIQLAEKVADALLEMSPDSPAVVAARCAGWTIPLNYQPVHECLKYLRVGPYEDYGKVTFQDVLKQYWAWLVSIIILVTIIVLFTFRAIRLSRRLQESRERFRLAAGCAADLVYECDIATDHLEWYGDIDHALGYESGEFPRTIAAWSKRIHPDDQNRVAESVTHRRNSREPLYIEYRILSKDGTELYWVDRGVAVVGKNGKPYKLIGTCTDITKHKQAEEALKKSEEKYRQLVQNANSIILQWNRNGRVTFFNEFAQKFFGYTEVEILGQHVVGTIVPETESTGRDLKPFMDNICNNPDKYTYNVNENMRKNGERVWIAWTNKVVKDENGNVTEALSIGTDITKRKQIEEKLRESEQFHKGLLDDLLTFVGVLKPSGEVVFINNTPLKVAGIELCDLTGKMFYDAFWWEYSDEARQTIKHGIDQCASGKRFVHDIQIKTSDSSLMWIEYSMHPVFDEEGEVKYLVPEGRDITESKQMQEFSERAQKMEAAGRVAGQVAHDFNNLLAPMIAYPELIRVELPEDSPIHEYINDMEKAAIRIAEINQQLLTLGRRGHYNVSPMNLNETIEQSLRQIHSLPEELIVNRDLAPDLMNVTGGESQIMRVLSNLIANACDAMHGDGKLTIRTENYYLDKSSDKWGGIPKGEYIKLTISDNGDGIPTDVLQKIFEPYFTTKKSDRKRGSGLGLSVVHAVIEDHGGHIDCESTPGEGTSFYIYLPVTREEVKVGPAEHIRSGDEYVLVVDDDNRQRTVTLSLLEKLGYTVEQAESGEKAIEHIRSKSPDLLLLDMIMPGGIDGTETYRSALEIDPSLKAIFVSGYAESDRVREGLELGVGAFIKKPLTLRSIALAVRKELDREVAVAVH